MPKFEWRTEEEERANQASLWDDAPETTSAPPSRRPSWRVIGLVAVLVVLLGATVWWRVDQRIEATLDAARNDVIASHNLVQRAVAENDQEVFRSVLSGRMPSWTSGEIELFTSGLLFDRSPMGLTLVEGSLPAILLASDEETDAGGRAADVEFSPDLNEAILTIDQPYRADAGGDIVTLRQTTIYRRGDFRWLLAPPLDEFWGDWVTSEGEYLSLIYPRRDAAVGGRLAERLDAEIGRMCATLADIRCSADLYLTVRLHTDPSVLAALDGPLGPLRRAREREDILELPAPTLVGLPAGEEDSAEWTAALDALANGYARHVLTAAIAQAVNWRCCEDAIMFNTLVEFQLGELGVMTWPIGPEDRRRVLDSRLRLSDLAYLLRGRFPAEVTDERLWEVRAAVDFLLNGIPGTTAADLQRTLINSGNLNQFMSSVVTGSARRNQANLPNNLDLAWWLYALDDSPLGAETADLSGISDELYLSCTAVDGVQGTDLSHLLRYVPDNNRWEEVYSISGFIWMSPMADPTTLLLQEFAWEFDTWRTNIWRDGQVVPVFAVPEPNQALSFGESDADGRRIVAYVTGPSDDTVTTLVVDLADCPDGCAAAEVPGRPLWSPDGGHVLYRGDSQNFPTENLVTAYENFTLISGAAPPREMDILIGPADGVADKDALTTVGLGRAPFWVDGQTFGYIRRNFSIGPAAVFGDEIVIASVDDLNPALIITEADIMPFLPETLSGRGLSISYVATHPHQPNRLFIVVLDTSARRAYVVMYDLETRLPEVRLDMLYEVSHSLSFSPDGRYLVMTGQDNRIGAPGDDSLIVLIHEIEANRTIPTISRLPFFLVSAGHDWTHDGRWLAVTLEDNLVGLIAPGTGEVMLLPHSNGACTAVAWLQP